jgi:hypothetical protein
MILGFLLIGALGSLFFLFSSLYFVIFYGFLPEIILILDLLV